MAKRFLTDINLAGNQLINATFEKLTADPTTGNFEGRLYYNTATDLLKLYTGSAWTAVGAITNVQGTTDEVDVSVSNGVATVSLPTTINANTTGSAAKLTTTRAIELSGDITGTANFDGSAAINISTTIAANSVALGTDTTGNYVADLTAGTGISVSGGGSETATVTVTNTGVTALAGTANQITASGSTGSITLSLPSAVTFPGTVTLNADPSSDLQAATKQYVDSVAQGLDVKASVKVATTVTGTLATAFANGSVVDGITLVTGDRILIKNQSTGSQNGIYTVNATGAPTRSSDMDVASDFPSSFTFVEQGTLNADTGWVCTNNLVVVGTTEITFSQFSGAGTYTAGNGLSLSGGAFSIDTSITVDKTTAQTLTNKTLTSPVVSGLSISDGSIVIEGATDDAFETTLTFTDPTADRTITFKNESGTVAYTADITSALTTYTRKYSADIGNASATSISVTHSLSTRDVQVQVYDNATYDTVEVDVVRTDTNTVTLSFASAPALNAYRVVVVG